jgi:hypothetical protein
MPSSLEVVHRSKTKILAKAKSFGALTNGCEQLRPQGVYTVILYQVQLVEAGVRAWQPILSAVGSVDLELLRP